MQSDPTQQLLLQAQCSFPVVHSRQQVMGHFGQMKTMLVSFLGPRKETIRTAMCNYLASEVEALEERDCQTFIKKAVKLLSGIQSRSKERRPGVGALSAMPWCVLSMLFNTTHVKTMSL